jgi:hypothetical protein
MVADVVAGASMSLQDAHGDIVGAIIESFDNKVDIDITIK